MSHGLDDASRSLGDIITKLSATCADGSGRQIHASDLHQLQLRFAQFLDQHLVFNARPPPPTETPSTCTADAVPASTLERHHSTTLDNKKGGIHELLGRSWAELVPPAPPTHVHDESQEPLHINLHSLTSSEMCILIEHLLMHSKDNKFGTILADGLLDERSGPPNQLDASSKREFPVESVTLWGAVERILAGSTAESIQDPSFVFSILSVRQLLHLVLTLASLQNNRSLGVEVRIVAALIIQQLRKLARDTPALYLQQQLPTAHHHELSHPAATSQALPPGFDWGPVLQQLKLRAETRSPSIDGELIDGEFRDDDSD